MVDSWSNESLSCYAILEQSGALVAAQSAYTIGTSGGANFAVTRPLKILDGPGAARVLDQQGNPYALDVYTRDRWNLLNRSSEIQSNFPTVLFYDPQFPLGILNFWPVSNTGGYTAYWDSYLQLGDFSGISSVFTLPPGYKEAIQRCLAVVIWPYFLSGQPDQWRVDVASKAKGNVKRTNIRDDTAFYDPELISRGTRTYNWYTDSQSSGS